MPAELLAYLIQTLFDCCRMLRDLLAESIVLPVLEEQLPRSYESQVVAAKRPVCWPGSPQVAFGSHQDKRHG